MAILSVSEVFVYPVKSCAGWALDRAEVLHTGFAHDREWLVTDETGRFITQRQVPAMALITPSLSGEALTLAAPGRAACIAPIVTEGPRRTVTVWEDSCEAVDQGSAAAEWLSAYLGRPARLMRMARDAHRPLKEKYRTEGDEEVLFGDSLPFLVISQASLDDLNSRLREPIPMNRFRPNIVVAGGAPFAEDAWKKIRIGQVTLRFGKQCDRCEITTIDQSKGEKGVEPLETLGAYRGGPKGIMFGSQYIPETTGEVRVGDPVEIIA